MLKQNAMRLLQSSVPRLWHFMKYEQYRYTSIGEPEIHVIHSLASRDKIGLDIGVHLGFYSRHLAGYCSSVIGFEPNPASAALARKALPRKVRIENVALSDKAGKAVLRIPKAGAHGAEDALGTLENANTLGGVPVNEVEVKAARLDDYDFPPVGIIKIDVEGHEEAVLRGGRELVRRDRPACMIEIEERHNPGALSRIVEYFMGLGYGAFYLSHGEFERIARPHIDIGALQGERASMYVNNFFFLPYPAPAIRRSRRIESQLNARKRAMTGIPTAVGR